ncbi:MAG: site-specific integrase [Verrucomicrobia bacterium]|nr:site-specific integrase [Verrucomicrobiota bacterium]
MNEEHPIEPRPDAQFERIGDSLYRRGGVIYARVRVNGKRTYRSTNTNNPTEARQWLRKWKTERFLLQSGIEPQGVVLHRARVTLAQLIDDYLVAGCPTKTMGQKSPATIAREKQFLGICRAYFGTMPAAAVTVGDCDKYRDWRQSGGYVSAETGKRTVNRTRKWSRLRTIDMELQVLSNVFRLAVRRAVLKVNPLSGRGHYSAASQVRHCREVAPTPDGLHKIEYWLRGRGEDEVADLACFLAYSGLRIGEAQRLDWECVDWAEKLLHVKREKRGIMPWVPMTADLAALLQQMKARACSHLLFPSPFDPNTPRERTAFGNRLRKACKAVGIGHVTAHGLRSYFVTQCRQSGLTDSEVAMLIGDKTGPAIIASTYGDLRPDHLLAQARRIRFKASGNNGAESSPGCSPDSMPTLSKTDVTSTSLPKTHAVSERAAA